MSITSHVAVIGAGPVGVAAALAFAREGARVTVFEANPEASKRFAGEWMHPPGYEILDDLGINILDRVEAATPGRGFVVHPDDGSDQLVLPYSNGTLGFSCEHHELVAALREHMCEQPGVELIEWARVTAIEPKRITYEVRGDKKRHMLRVDRVVGADGRKSLARRALGLEAKQTTISHMAGVLLKDTELQPSEFGHVILGGPGPVLTYRVLPNVVRMIIDVPLGLRPNTGKAAFLWDAYGPVMPEFLREPLRRSLEDKPISWTNVGVRLREDYGREDLALVGDAVGHYHPLTATGMTMGFRDAASLATRSFADHVARRKEESRTPGLLAVLLYDVFSEDSADTHALRKAVFDLWKRSPAERVRTMQFLATQDVSSSHFWKSFLRVVAGASGSVVGRAVERGRSDGLRGFVDGISGRSRFLAKSVAKRGPSGVRSNPARLVARPVAGAQAKTESEDSTLVALRSGAKALLDAQTPSGAWEGEVVWCPMLAAQYVLMHWIMDRPLEPARAAALLRNFEATQREDGTWSMGRPNSSLFVTAMVYAASRYLGVPATDRVRTNSQPQLAGALRFIRGENGIVSLPTWGKQWFAMLGLYSWDGVNPVLPEVWRLPRRLPLHPSKYFSHTRLIYMGLAYLYGRKVCARQSALTEELREELFPQGWESVDFAVAAGALREGELYNRPPLAMRAMYKACRALEKVHSGSQRRELLNELLEYIRYELHTTRFASISPVNGLLNILALWANDPSDPDIERAFTAFEGWIWEDADDGLRVAGARSATWDTSRALNALAAAAPHVDLLEARRLGEDYLTDQQIREPGPHDERFDRNDPSGGFTFAESWHGWPASDCTGEALSALMRGASTRDASTRDASTRDASTHGVGPERMTTAAVDDAVGFILACQNEDGGFGTYERRRTGSLEWMSPAEMFGEAMTEMSHVEATAACVIALADYRVHRPGRADVNAAILAGRDRIIDAQRADGSWEGSWGVNFTYGTMFAVRGLRAAGLPPQSPHIRRACQWLLERQHADGGWGERVEGCWSRTFEDDKESRVLHSAWALMALLSAQEHNWSAITAAAQFLARAQQPDGSWKHGAPAGLFFRTALLDYTLWPVYFPVWALGEFETQRLDRLAQADKGRSRTHKHQSPVRVVAELGETES